MASRWRAPRRGRGAFRAYLHELYDAGRACGWKAASAGDTSMALVPDRVGAAEWQHLEDAGASATAAARAAAAAAAAVAVAGKIVDPRTMI